MPGPCSRSGSTIHGPGHPPCFFVDHHQLCCDNNNKAILAAVVVVVAGGGGGGGGAGAAVAVLVPVLLVYSVGLVIVTFVVVAFNITILTLGVKLTFSLPSGVSTLSSIDYHHGCCSFGLLLFMLSVCCSGCCCHDGSVGCWSCVFVAVPDRCD